MHVALLPLALLGHVCLWVATINRIHAISLPRWLVRLLTGSCFTALGLLPLVFAWWMFWGVESLADSRWLPWLLWSGRVYLALCGLVAVASVAWWIRRVVLHRPPDLLRFHRTRLVDLAPDGEAVTSEEEAHHFLVHLPRNEMLRLDLTERMIEVPRLTPELDGLSIVHMSDFHLTGLVGKSYFREVVRLSNKIEPDLVAITGDLVDRTPCIDWLPDTLGRLRARHGVYFVLGNHDRRIGPQRLREVLSQSGLVDLGGRWIEVRLRGQSVILAGNELPWLGPAADMSDCPPRSDRGQLRIVLAHSPDQLAWARRHDADLLLAGHTHGGQIRIPLIGAIFSPSWSGVRYASGVFHDPPTILHVTRGVSGEFPVRLNCPPEMVHLSLHVAPKDDA